MVSPINLSMINHLLNLESVSPLFTYIIHIAASVSRGHGYTADATAGVKQRPATTTAAAASARGHRFDRPLRRQPYAISRAVANQLQPAHGAATLEPPQQLKQTGIAPGVAERLLTSTNLTSHAIPISPADRFAADAILYMRNKPTLQAVGQHTTHRSLSFCPFYFRDNLGSNGSVRRIQVKSRVKDHPGCITAM